MSVISLQFGQCGNQIGNSLYSTVIEDINAKDVSKNNCWYHQAVDKWFDINKHGKWEPRSILIDTECKVVQSAKPSPFKFKNVVAKPFGGSANNWACGYTTNGKKLISEVMNAVRKETENCDLLSSFLNLYSSSGGTGSGVGSFVIEQLRDAYPNKNIVNTVILPYVQGEVVTQSYNSLLTLSNLYSLADTTILFENERLHYACKYSLEGDVSFSQINTVIAQQLAALYQPLNISTASLLNNMTSHPSYKFLQIRNEPHFSKRNIKFEAPVSWKALLGAVSKQSRFDVVQQNSVKLKAKTLCSSLITRALDYPTEDDVKTLKQNQASVSWLPKQYSFSGYHQRQKFLNFEKFVLLISNSNSVYVPLNSITEEAWRLFTHGAYLHHYKKYDIDEDFFLNSNLEMIQQKMPQKTITEIRQICQKHTNLALRKWLKIGENDQKYDTVKNWLEILKRLNSTRTGPVYDIIPRVLKYIALYEKRSNSPIINLRDCYLVLSDICNGMSSKKLDKASNHFLLHCLTKLAEAIKNGEIESYKSHLKSLKNYSELCKYHATRKGSTDAVLNPLNVNKRLLKMTEVDKYTDIFEESSSEIMADPTQAYFN
ncbi:hypothetical protein NQ315_000908 [Exocentrus adspersus]|uniref:Tubulin/FtsZ GTPase domain-containing protein n=1 Tax=Exocentrus adspersus TaxID=1586481 RepID=A0AAV8WF95_9CUCU|nr:hypothetical protein NQ315_000908 [Exocentrus adspersus]